MLPVVLLALLAALIIGDPGRIDRQKTWLRVTTSAVIALLTLANLFAAARLVGAIITNNKIFAINATGLLATGAVIWATNVIAFTIRKDATDQRRNGHADKFGTSGGRLVRRSGDHSRSRAGQRLS